MDATKRGGDRMVGGWDRHSHTVGTKYKVVD